MRFLTFSMLSSEESISVNSCRSPSTDALISADALIEIKLECVFRHFVIFSFSFQLTGVLMTQQAQEQLNTVRLQKNGIQFGPCSDHLHLLDYIVELDLRFHEP